MNGRSDAVIFPCELCGHDLLVPTDGLNEETPFKCDGCGAVYGEWRSIRGKLTELLKAYDGTLPEQNLDELKAPACSKYIH